jgi:hypothetical protein
VIDGIGSDHIDLSLFLLFDRTLEADVCVWRHNQTLHLGLTAFSREELPQRRT